MEWVIAGIIILVVLLIALFFASYKKAPPDTAFFITGIGKRKILIGKAGFKIPFFQRLDKVPLNIIQVDIKTRSPVPTNEFININVDGVANVKVSSDKDKLSRAAEIFLKESLSGINSIVQQVLDGNMREIIGQLKLTDLVHNRDEFAARVKESADKDMEKMGIEIINFTVQNFSDGEGVLVDLGIDHIQVIKKAAAIARANSERDIEISKSKAAEEANRARVEADKKISEQNQALAIRRAELKLLEDTKKAEADTAYDIQRQIRLAEINTAEINAAIAKEKRLAELGKMTVEVEEQKLNATVRKSAEAEKYAAEQRALADFVVRQKAAEAHAFEQQKESDIRKIKAETQFVEAQKIAEAHAYEQQRQSDLRKIKADTHLVEEQKAAEGRKAAAAAERIAKEAEAAGISAVGRAEAEAIDKRAEALKKLEEAGRLELILNSDVLPKIVAAMTEPVAKAMANIDNITMYGEGNQAKLTGDITTSLVKITNGIQDATGIDMKTLLSSLAGGFIGGNIAESKQSKKAEKAEKEVKPKHVVHHKDEGK